MTDKESLSKLEKILKQLEKISNNTGISAGVKGEKGETKKRNKLTTEEITRQTKIAKIYKRILGTGYNEETANKTAERFRIKMGISTTYYVKTETFLESIKNNIELLSTNLNFSSIESLLNDIKTNLTSTSPVSSGSINTSEIKTILDDIRRKIFMGINVSTGLTLGVVEGLLREIKNKLESTNNLDIVQTLLNDIKTNLIGLVTGFSRIEIILKDIETKIGSLNFSSLETILKDIETKIGSLNFSSLETILKDIETKLTGLIGGLTGLIGGLNPTIFTNIKDILTQIETNTRTSSGGGFSINRGQLIQIFENSFDKFRRDLKWTEFSKKITDYIDSSKVSAGKIFDTLSNVGGLALLGTGLLLVVTALAKTGLVDVGQSLKVILLITTFVGLITFLAKNLGKMKGVGKNFAILSATIVLTTLALAGLAKLPFLLILEGIGKAAMVYTALFAALVPLVIVSWFIEKNNLRETVISLGIFVGIVIASTFLIAGIAFLPWELIFLGLLKFSTVAAAMYGVLYAFKKLKPKDLQATMKSLAMFVGISAAVLLLTIGFSKVPWEVLGEGLAKMLTVSAALLGVLKVMEYIKPRNVLKSMLGLAIFSVILLGFMYLVDKLKNIDVESTIKSILGIGLALAAFSLLVRIIGQLVQSGLPQILIGAITMIGLSFILGYLADNLSLFANKPWGEIYKGLGLGTLAIILFGLVVAGIGALMLTGVGAAVLAAGAVAVVGLSIVLLLLAYAMGKFANKPWVEIAKGVIVATIGITLFGIAVASIGALMLSGVGAAVLAAGAVAVVGLSFILSSLVNTMSKFANKPWAEISKGIKLATLGIVLFGIAVAGIGALMLSGVGAALLAAGSVAVLGLSFVLSTLADAMGKFANKPWDDIKNGIKSSIEAVSSFGLFLAKFGVLSVLFAPLIAIGAVALLAISNVMASFAESLSKYQNIDGANLKIIGEGMQSLGIGLIAMLGGNVAGVGAGIVGRLSSFFGLDPVSQIRKFEKVDVEKIYKLGEGIKMLGDGLRTLSSSDINLSKITDGVIKLTKPLAEFSGSLEKFSDAYTKFEKIKMQADTQFNIQADTGVKEAIKEATDRQLDVQIEQLSELRRNNQLMEILINRSGDSGGIIGSFGDNQGGSITSPSFRTKNDYLANMKMMTMTISNA